MPQVSVNIITKNRADLLARALASVRRQSFSDYEIVVVDDGSTDKTGELLKNFDGKLRIITHQISKGIAASRQEALEASKGKYIAILDDDDEWINEDKLKDQFQLLDKHPEIVLCGTARKIWRKNRFWIDVRPKSDKLIRRTMLFRNNFFTSSVFLKKDAALKAGGFRFKHFDLAEDYDLWLRMGREGQMRNLSRPCILYRLPDYSREKFSDFLKKQKLLIGEYRHCYPGYFLADVILLLRLWLFRRG